MLKIFPMRTFLSAITRRQRKLQKLTQRPSLRFPRVHFLLGNVSWWASRYCRLKAFQFHTQTSFVRYGKVYFRVVLRLSVLLVSSQNVHTSLPPSSRWCELQVLIVDRCTFCDWPGWRSVLVKTLGSVLDTTDSGIGSRELPTTEKVTFSCFFFLSQLNVAVPPEIPEQFRAVITARFHLLIVLDDNCRCSLWKKWNATSDSIDA